MVTLISLADQKKKIKYKPLEDLLVNNYKLPIDEQKNILNEKFEAWKGNLE